MVAKKGLGRGFDSLFDIEVIDEQFDTTAELDKNLSVVTELDLVDIIPNPNQPRQKFDKVALDELAQSIKSVGVFTPIVVVKNGDKYEIIAGERRWRASKLAGKSKIPALVRTLDGQNKLLVSLIENLQREDLNDLERATSILKLQSEYNKTDAEVAEQLGLSISAVRNLLRLLKLPDFAKVALVDGVISSGHARQILALDETERQHELLDLIRDNGISVRAAEQFVVTVKTENANKIMATSSNFEVSDDNKNDKPEKKKTTERVSNTTEFAKKAMDKLGLTVRHQITTKKGGGKVIIEFKNADDFAKIEKLF